MTRISLRPLSTVLRTTVLAAAAALTTMTAATAEDHSLGLQKFLDNPTSFVAVSEGAPGPVTFASMSGDTLAVQFVIPTHAEDMFGEVVGTVDASGVFTGNGVLISEQGRGRSAPITMVFQEDGTIVADIQGGNHAFGFMSNEMF